MHTVGLCAEFDARHLRFGYVVK